MWKLDPIELAQANTKNFTRSNNIVRDSIPELKEPTIFLSICKDSL